eukprot:1160894-Pelagomonas_calceolata.AAC.23
MLYGATKGCPGGRPGAQPAPAQPAPAPSPPAAAAHVPLAVHASTAAVPASAEGGGGSRRQQQEERLRGRLVGPTYPGGRKQGDMNGISGLERQYFLDVGTHLCHAAE